MFSFGNNVNVKKKKKSCQLVDRVGLVQEMLAKNASLQQFMYSALSLLERLRPSCTSDFSCSVAVRLVAQGGRHLWL